MHAWPHSRLFTLCGSVGMSEWSERPAPCPRSATTGEAALTMNICYESSVVRSPPAAKSRLSHPPHGWVAFPTPAASAETDRERPPGPTPAPTPAGLQDRARQGTVSEWRQRGGSGAAGGRRAPRAQGRHDRARGARAGGQGQLRRVGRARAAVGGPEAHERLA